MEFHQIHDLEQQKLINFDARMEDQDHLEATLLTHFRHWNEADSTYEAILSMHSLLIYNMFKEHSPEPSFPNLRNEF